MKDFQQKVRSIHEKLIDKLVGREERVAYRRIYNGFLAFRLAVFSVAWDKNQ